MRAAWWWIDRWRKSTAYTDMTLAEQGAYRNLLDELWLRDGLLPLTDKTLGKIAGDALEWPSVRKVVMARFIKTPEGYRNETHDKIMHESQVRAQRQKRYRDRQRNVTDNVGPSPSPSPSQSKSPKKTPPKSPKGDGYSDRFERFWKAYPKKIGKGAAYKAWKRKGDVDIGILLPAVEHQTKSPQWKKDGGQFIPNPATWINQRRWEDEIPVANNGKPSVARVPAGHPCHGRREGERWEDNAIKDGWWWTKEVGKKEKVI